MFIVSCILGCVSSGWWHI